MERTDILRLVRDNIRNLEPYSTARDEYRGALGILLDANENPYGEGLNRYPARLLRSQLLERIASLKGFAPEQVFLGNGSDESIDLCYRVFCRPGIDNAVAIAPSYGMYRVCADVNDVEYRAVPLEPDFSLPVDRLLAAADGNSRLLFICSRTIQPAMPSPRRTSAPCWSVSPAWSCWMRPTPTFPGRGPSPVCWPNIPVSSSCRPFPRPGAWRVSASASPWPTPDHHPFRPGPLSLQHRYGHARPGAPEPRSGPHGGGGRYLEGGAEDAD